MCVLFSGSITNMTKKQYFDHCKNFDWYFDFSDDYFGVVLPRRQIQRQLEEAYMCFPEWKPIYMAWHDYYYSGENWGIEKAPLPTYEMFNIKEDEE